MLEQGDDHVNAERSPRCRAELGDGWGLKAVADPRRHLHRLPHGRPRPDRDERRASVGAESAGVHERRQAVDRDRVRAAIREPAAVLRSAGACQGAFAALLAPSALALLATTFTDSEERGKAFGIFSAVVASGAGVGLIIGGSLTSALNWRWCLYVNLIFAGISLVGGQLLLDRQPKTGVRMDVPGVIVASGGMFCVVYGFANAATHSWHTPSTWGFLAAGVALLIVFAFWQTRAAQPLLPPRIVLDRNRGGAYLAVLLV